MLKFSGSPRPEWRHNFFRYAGHAGRSLRRSVSAASSDTPLKSAGGRCLAGIALLMFITVGIGCSDGGGSGGSIAPTAPSDPVEEAVAGTFLSLVTTPEGQVVPNAAVGTLGVTDDNGVATGSTPTAEVAGAAAAAGDPWLRVSAPGYAPDYIRKVGTLDDVAIYESFLTPVDSRAVFRPGTATVMKDEPDSPILELTVPGDVFADAAVFLELTRIDPLTLGTLFAGDGSGDPSYPQIAFSIEARDGDDAEATFMAGNTATVQIKDDGILGDSPRFAWFNPDTGLWENLAFDACRRVDANHVELTLQHFSTYGGMGGNAPSGQGQSYAGARADYQAAVNDWAEQGGGEVPPQEVIDALNDMAQAAEALANASRDEQAKQRLLAVAAQAQLIGQDAVSDRMIFLAKEITREIAENHINNPDCGRLREMMAAMTQCQLLGLYSLSNELEYKIRLLLDVCNNWYGTIIYTMAMENPYPDMDIPELTKHSGPGTWTEHHDVVLSINPETFNITGDDLVSLVAPEVTYRAMEDPGDCVGESYFELRNQANPQIGDLVLTINGTFEPGDRPVFTLDMPAKSPQSDSISTTFTQYYQGYDADCNLETIGPSTVTTIPDYKSMLVGVGHAPPKSLADILNNGQYHDHGEFEIIKGYEEVPLNASAMGVWPFSKVTVQWHFVQDKPALEESTP